jgi:hypothetical protein
VLFITGCSEHSSQDISGEPEPITYKDAKNIIAPDYFENLKLQSNLIVERKDQYGTHNYNAELLIDRQNSSRLFVKQSSTFEITLLDSIVNVRFNDDDPIKVDLTNRTQDILEFREISVVALNPFRYMDSRYAFFRDDSHVDTTIITASLAGEHKKGNKVNIVVQKRTGFISDLYLISPSGDMGRHVQYKKPVRFNGVLLPSEVIIYYPYTAHIIREHYIMLNLPDQNSV